MMNNQWMHPHPMVAHLPHEELFQAALPLPVNGGEQQYEAAAAPLQQPPPAPLTLVDHKFRISEALKHVDGSDRDAALLAALRGVASELEAAEDDRARAEDRVASARELFDWATGSLSGYSKTKAPKVDEAEMVKEKRGRKRKGAVNEQTDGEVDEFEERFYPPEEGPLLPPLVATPGGGMSERQIVSHKDAFYLKLCGVPHAELASYAAPASLVNLKTRAQLDEMAYIASHWDTGTEGVDVMDFRRQHKTYYTKMKMCKANIGRRTGHHLRDVVGGTVDGRKAFCRRSKDGDRSLMYVALEDLYDAIFEMHCLGGHRGWLLSKKLANLKYANIPQDQLKCFIETCPVCSSRKGGNARGRPKLRSDDDQEQYDLETNV